MQEDSILERCHALDLSRNSFYFQPQGESALNIKLMRLVDKEFTKRSLHGVQEMPNFIQLEEVYCVNEKRFRCRLRLMGAESRCAQALPEQCDQRQKGLSLPVAGYTHRASEPCVNYRHRLYIAMGKGFMCLTAVIGWYSCYVHSWQISDTLDSSFCLEALHNVLLQHLAPKIFNTNQGSQYTNDLFTGAFLKEGIKVIMDGKGPRHRQCIHRKALAERGAAVRLLSKPGRWERAAQASRRVLHLLQQPTSTSAS